MLKLLTMETSYIGNHRTRINTILTRNGKATLDHFKENVITDQNGCYKVCLSWFEGHNVLPKNMDAVTKQCVPTATRKKVKKYGLKEKYSSMKKS